MINDNILKNSKKISEEDLEIIKNLIGSELVVNNIVSENGDINIIIPESDDTMIIPKQYCVKADSGLNESMNDNWEDDITKYIVDNMSEVKIQNKNDLTTIRKELMLKFDIKDTIENSEIIENIIKDNVDTSEYDETTEEPLRESVSTKKDTSTFYTSFNDYFKKTKSKEYDEGKFRPMSPNIPDEETITSYNNLRDGKFITVDGKNSQINKIKGNNVYLDVIDDTTQEHKIVKYNIIDLLRKMKKGE